MKCTFEFKLDCARKHKAGKRVIEENLLNPSPQDQRLAYGAYGKKNGPIGFARVEIPLVGRVRFG